MAIRDRVKELRRVRAGDLMPHPKNWRTHTRFQQDVLRGVLAEVGMADALLVRELPTGELQLIDGHLRAETNPGATVPVLVLDLDDAEAEKVLLTHDPLTSLAGIDEERLSDLLDRNGLDHGAVGEMLSKLAREIDATDMLTEVLEIEITPSWQVVVDVDGEQEQKKLYERMRTEGYRCRLLTL